MMISLLAFVTGCGSGANPKTINSTTPISNDVKFGKDDYKKIITANNELGFELLHEVEEDANNNIFISPASLFMALSMVYNGADGKTKEEIAKTLHIEGMEADELNQANASWLTKLMKENDEIQLNIANSIWLNELFHFQDDFAKYNKDYFNAEIQEIDINDSDSVKQINDWVKKSTNQKIVEIVQAPLDSDLVTLLVNAIYFKGDWSHEFDKDLTKDQTFHLQDGSIKVAPLMSLNERLSYLENEHFQAVQLPYGDGEMSMKVFLPKENSGLEEFKKLLTNENWMTWNKEFNARQGTVLLPKFQLEYETLLNDALMKLGMGNAFADTADFSKMIKEGDPLKISKVKQKTFIDVNEEGTEAAAVTSIEVVTESASIDDSFFMEVNRPFFFTITDDETDTILFMGSISNP
ncbi:serpin B [Sporosarcina sp. JAI121]|nr:serpin B [Sporosarcina sp. JAI121]